MFTNLIIFSSLALVTLSSPDYVTNKVTPRKEYFTRGPEQEGDSGLDPKIGHGIVPNFRPRYSPPVQTEHIPDMKDFLSLKGRN